jgi:branched-chain amino acid transport system ATP-binding protein
MIISSAQKYRPLLIATLAVIALPFALAAMGLSHNTGTMIVALAVAAMGLNLCIGYTGLVSFGHGAWFGIGAYAAGLIQLNWFPGQIWLPLLLSTIVVAAASAFVGAVILRRRGVYFSLLTLALAALTYTTAFRWTKLTGGEDGLGGLKRGSLSGHSLDNALYYYIVVAVLCLGVLFVLLRLVRSLLLWFGLLFVAFVLYSPGGLVGIWATFSRRWWPPPEETAAMSRRKIYEGLTLPDFLRSAAGEGPVLEVEGVSKSFGGIRAVRNASLEVRPGEIHALIGPNGAGKTTLFNLVSGLYAPDAGSIKLHGRDIQGVPSELICHQGLARSFQITNLFKGLSIYENLRLSLQARAPGRFNIWRDIDHFAGVHAETAELIKFLGLEGIENIVGGDLSYGGQRLVDLGIALGSKPQVLLLDEPLAGLAAAERERVSNLVRNIAQNIPVLIVEHDIDRVLGFSHEVTVMNQGEVLMTGSSEAVRADQRVQEIYTGTGLQAVAHSPMLSPARETAPILRFEAVNTFYGKSHILHDATLDVRSGEIVALLGRNGAGKSTLLKTLAGLVPLSSGEIAFASRDITRLAAPDIARLGIGYVPQGRGLFAGMTVRENLALGRLARKSDGSEGAVWDEGQILSYFPRLRERMDVAADYLSGGEQQMVAVARAMSGNVKLLLLDEPFEGLAPAVILELFGVFDRLRQHVSILIVEHNLDLVLALADRVFALERGAVFHEGPATPLLTDLAYRKKILWL